ncbi:MAG: ABC transporter substrate-binding protein [Caldiserica bacterium]|nr:ABC transporter substrate-binding protein [Caldisericota bacterium]
MINWKKHFVLVLSLALSLVLITSCTAPSPTPTSSLPTPTSAASPTSSTTAPPREKMVRVAQGFPVYIDPGVAIDNVSNVCVVNFYDPLLTIDENGDPQPKVAESWKFDPDTLTYTLKIRKGIKFHNGDELKASDVVFSLKRLIDMGEGWGYLFRGVVKEVSAPDAETVKIALERPVGPFLFYLEHVAVLNEKQVMENAQKEGPYGEFGDYGKSWLLTHDAGSGPYMVKEVKLEEHVIGIRNPNYWQEIDKDAPDSFKIIGTTEPVTVRTLMAKKELEISDEWQPTENYDAMSKLPGVKIANLRTGAPLMLMFNTSKPPLDDVHFRRAVMYVFDYAVCQEQILPTAERARGPISPIIPGSDPTLPLLERNVEKAKAELAQSKYAGQLDQYPIEFWWNSVVPDQEKIALLLQSNCAEIGIKVNVVKSSWTQFIDAAAKPDTTPHIFPVIHSSITYPEAGSLLYQIYHSNTRGTFFNMHWFDDTTQAEIDSMLEDALATLDKNERYEKYKAIIRKIMDLAPDIVAVEMPQRHAYQAEYLMWPTAKAAETGGKICLLPELRMQFKDMRFIGGE